MTTNAWAPTWPEAVINRYLTVGGAHLDLSSHTFWTDYTYQGRHHIGHRRKVDGFLWRCHGCGQQGGVGFYREPYLPNERQKALDDSNEHASACRAMPKPGIN
ncbi:hypothetical protein DR950_41860 [Kitasatospora xanthocidica]|uniref:Uncharacterized protein n=1 Tax=Kitasatospora xanthocidica TaxID=83382 RepID=A0A372ZIS7_9ACTN|nr:hypothetical protein [Kitasatospora xanthocidica]RGD55412.1 hypothetical protein DR950_41860 [Kitasatospora xanthocidica]